MALCPAHDIAEFKSQYFGGSLFSWGCRDLRMCKRQTLRELLPVPWEILDVRRSPWLVEQEMPGQL